ncbi:protein phosphatase regulator [Coemansia brasiliensis]|uniref:Protein phosphatase regulator n=1 Tax=Coemansia brasiliensis TaxID=2650707 RepID=A0A9W8IE53_9FUNG|nr:protein phosphatase regulator [Coemansia brasiliensis]
MNDATDHNDLIQKWLDVNPGTEEQARFYLEANNWDLNAALSNFYEGPPMSEGLSPPHQDPSLPLDPNLATPSAAHPPAVAPVISAGPIHAPAEAPQSSATPSTSVPRRRYGSGARIATLSSLGSQANGSDGEEDDSQEWYAGGERSGMAIQPPSQDQDADEGRSLVDRILRRASEGGPALSGNSGGSSAEHPRRFIGHGRTIGSDVTGDSENNLQSDASDNDDDEVAVRKLTFWRNGFSIGDGPLYNLEDPANRQNLDAILQGRAPLDILNVRPGQRVEMQIAVRRGEDYVPPAAPPAQPFSGQGRRLGSITPAVEGTAASSTASGASSQHTQAPASKPIVLDPDQPTVQVQIRLADGTRLVARANPSHTIGDLRSYVLSQRPEAALRPFAFKTIMPPKVLDDYNATIKDAGIANAAIAQYFI